MLRIIGNAGYAVLQEPCDVSVSVSQAGFEDSDEIVTIFMLQTNTFADIVNLHIVEHYVSPDLCSKIFEDFSQRLSSWKGLIKFHEMVDKRIAEFQNEGNKKYNKKQKKDKQPERTIIPLKFSTEDEEQHND